MLGKMAGEGRRPTSTMHAPPYSRLTVLLSKSTIRAPPYSLLTVLLSKEHHARAAAPRRRHLLENILRYLQP